MRKTSAFGWVPGPARTWKESSVYATPNKSDRIKKPTKMQKTSRTTNQNGGDPENFNASWVALPPADIWHCAGSLWLAWEAQSEDWMGIIRVFCCFLLLPRTTGLVHFVALSFKHANDWLIWSGSPWRAGAKTALRDEENCLRCQHYEAWRLLELSTTLI